MFAHAGEVGRRVGADEEGATVDHTDAGDGAGLDGMSVPPGPRFDHVGAGYRFTHTLADRLPRRTDYHVDATVGRVGYGVDQVVVQKRVDRDCEQHLVVGVGDQRHEAFRDGCLSLHGPDFAGARRSVRRAELGKGGPEALQSTLAFPLQQIDGFARGDGPKPPWFRLLHADQPPVLEPVHAVVDARTRYVSDVAYFFCRALTQPRQSHETFRLVLGEFEGPERSDDLLHERVRFCFCCVLRHDGSPGSLPG